MSMPSEPPYVPVVQPYPPPPADTYPQGPAPVAQYTPPPQYVVVVQPTSSAATVSLVFGIIGALGGWCMLGLPCVVAVAAGHQGMADTKTGERGGRGMAAAGLVLGYLFGVPWLIVGIFWLAGAVAQGT